MQTILEHKLPSDLIEEVTEQYAQQRVGVYEVLRADEHISHPYMRARFLAQKTEIPQIVILNNSYFVVHPDLQVTGPSAELCQIDRDSAREWANTALEFADTEMFSLANEKLPQRPASLR